MANSRAKSGGWSTGEQLTAAQATTMDVGQANALCRSGATALTAATSIQGGGFSFVIDMSDNAASTGIVLVGDQNFEFSIGSTGNVALPAGDLQLTGSGWPILGSRTLTDFAPMQSWHFDAAEWIGNSLGYGILECVGSTLVSATARLRLPIGMVITSVKVEVLGNLSGATMPTSMPTASLLHFAAGAYATPTATIGTQADTSANQAAFETNHTIVISGLSHTVLNTSDYLLAVTSPSGGNTDTGFRIYRAFVTGTLATLRTA